ncbi:MAG: alternative ribosome rescue aminoacyl-tRNA hydrolase ArfB [Hyphomicrobiales bacterium]|jgi:ribosome-associated protein|nr:alternative ribosome rescue aminoacyl-tRNA hydrolase ArfB [Hyphomicrobiales bacterium]
MLRITRSLAIDPADLSESFVRSSGPGGQNVNKLSTAVQLRYPIDRLIGMPDDMRARLAALAGRRLTLDGEIVIIAESFRTQAQNRDDALARLVALFKAAAVRPKPRIATRPTKASKVRRIDAKVRRGVIKRARGSGRSDDQ